MRTRRAIGVGIATALCLAAVVSSRRVARVAHKVLRPYNLPAPSPRPPFASLSVRQVEWKDCKAVDAVLEAGAFVCGVVDCAVLRGFSPRMTLDAARATHGAPAGEWTDPLYDVHAYYYDVPEGRISLCLAPDSGSGHWVTVGYPARSSCNDVLRDPRILAQLRELQASDAEIYLRLIPAGGAAGGIGLHAIGSRCDALEFHGTEAGSTPSSPSTPAGRITTG